MASWVMFISGCVVGFRPMSSNRTLEDCFSIADFVYRSSESLVSHVPRRRIVGVWEDIVLSLPGFVVEGEMVIVVG